MTAAEVLVIFLSVALAIFLVLGIILVIYLIVIAQRIKSVAETAEKSVRGLAGAIATLQKAAAPAVVSRFVMDQISRFTEKQRSNKKGDE